MRGSYLRYPKDQTPYIKERLRDLITQRGYKARGLCLTAGIGRTYLFNLFNDKIQTVDAEKLQKLLEVMRMTEDEFFERPPGSDAPRFIAPKSTDDVRVPVFGEIPDGSPTWCEGEPLPVDAVDAHPRDRQERAFALRVRGSSMSPRFEHGDIIFLRPLSIELPVKDPKNPVPRAAFQSLDGRPVAVQVNGEATLRVLHIKALGGSNYEVSLEPINSDYDTIVIGPEDEVKFQGEVYRMYRYDP